MPHYFFDLHDGQLHRDEEGFACADFETARKEAMITLLEVSRWGIPADGDRQAYSVLVREEHGTIVYIATLTFAGLRLDGGDGRP